MSDTKIARKELQRFYSLTNQLRVQLGTLDELVPSIRVEVREADDADIESLVIIVMMEAHSSAQEDLKTVMEQIKAVTAQKNKVRCQLLKQQPDRGLDLLSVHVADSRGS